MATIDYKIHSASNRLPVNQDETIVYHYTNSESFKNILLQGNIRLTHFKCLNDSYEGKILFEDILDIIKDSEFRALLEERYNVALRNLYIGSFSRHGNLLSQWKNYGNVCIGLDLEKNKRLNLGHIIEDSICRNADTSGVQIVPCSYINGDTKKYAVNFVKWFKENRTESSDILALLVGSSVFHLKHIKFQEEQELRIIAYLWRRNPYKDSNKDYINYIIHPKAIRKIVVGPSNQQDIILGDICAFLNKLKEDYTHVEIWKSTIPYTKHSGDRTLNY